MNGVIFEYIKNILFIILFLIYINTIGKAFSKENATFSVKLIIGYLIHSAAVGIFGIVCQFLKTSWMIFAGLNVLTIIILILISLIILKKRNLFHVNFNDSLVNHLKNNWFTYIVASLLILASLLYTELQLLNNHLDDGLYLLRIAQLPYLQDPFNTIVSSGLKESGVFSLANFSYLFNVFDLEASVYCYILSTPATIFARFTLSWINYFIFIHCGLWLIQTILKNSQFKIALHYQQYITNIFLLFGFYDSFIKDIIVVSNDWTFNTGMWYGSSIVRCCSIFMFFIPLITKERITIRRYAPYFCLVSLALMTKSSIAVPIIFLAAILYFVFYLKQFNKNYVLIPILLLCLFSFIMAYRYGIPDYSWYEVARDTNSKYFLVNYAVVMEILLSNLKLISFWISVIMIFISFLIHRNTILNRWNQIMLFLFIAIFCPIINFAFLKISIYNFVAARAATLYMYTLIVTGYLYLIYFIYVLLKKQLMYVLVSSATTAAILLTFGVRYNEKYDIKLAMNYLYENQALYPQSVLNLSIKLDEINQNHSDSLYVLSPFFIDLYGYTHPLSTFIRIRAFDIISVSAIPRFSGGLGNISNFSAADQTIFTNFLEDPETYYISFEDLLYRYPEINCIVTTDDRYSDYLNEQDFYIADQLLYDDISFYLYLKR